MRITESRLRRIIRSVIKESAQSADLFADYQSKLSTMNLEYSYCEEGEYSGTVSCGFIKNGEDIDFENLISPSGEDIFDELLYSIFPELKDLEGYGRSDLGEKIVNEIKRKLGNDLEEFYKDLEDSKY